MSWRIHRDTMAAGWLLGEFKARVARVALTEPSCGSRIVTDGFVWPNSIWLELSASGRRQAEVTAETLFADLERVGLILRQRRYDPQRSVLRITYRGKLVTYDDFGKHVLRDTFGLHGVGFGHMNKAPVMLVVSGVDGPVIEPVKRASSRGGRHVNVRSWRLDGRESRTHDANPPGPLGRRRVRLESAGREGQPDAPRSFGTGAGVPYAYRKLLALLPIAANLVVQSGSCPDVSHAPWRRKSCRRWLGSRVNKGDG